MQRKKYYLFTYLCIDSLSAIENITRRTDQNMALFCEEDDQVELVSYYELERYTGLKKHERSFLNKEQCVAFIDEILRECGLTFEEIDVVWGNRSIQKGVNKELLKKIEKFFVQGSFYPHHYYHVFSCLQMNTEKCNKDMLVLSVDGGPDFVDVDAEKPYTYAGCYRKGGNLSFFPVASPGPLWTLAKNHFGMKEGSLMALASACNTELYGFNASIPLIKNTRDLEKAYNYFAELVSYAEKAFSENDESKFSGYDERFSQEECMISCVIKEIQRVSLLIMDENIKQAHKLFNIDFTNCILGVSGGFALNCPSNTYLIEKYRFQEFLSPPCVNDSGISLGMGLFFMYMQKQTTRFCLKSAFHGYRCTDEELETCQKKYRMYIKDVCKFDVNKAVKDLQTAPLLWVEGAAEIGPRALGHRSIIADPRNANNKNELNIYKQRYFWQPVAPIVLHTYGAEWFEKYFYSPFMLHIFKFKKEKAEQVPVVVHFDNTARVQSLKKEDSFLYLLMHEFYKETGVPMICNTSLNDRGEAIINTLDQAINFALRKKVNIIYFEGVRIELCNHEKYPETSYETRKYSRYFEYSSLNFQYKNMNPLKLPVNILHYYYTSPSLMKKYNVSNINDAKIVERLVKAVFRKTKIDTFLEQ